MVYAESSRMAQERAAREEEERIRYDAGPLSSTLSAASFSAGPTSRPGQQCCYAGTSSHLDARLLMKLGVWIGFEHSPDEGCNGPSYNALTKRYMSESSKPYHVQSESAPRAVKLSSSKPCWKNVVCSLCHRQERAREVMTILRKPLPFDKSRTIWTFPCSLDGRKVFALMRNCAGSGTWLFFLAGEQGGYLKHQSMSVFSNSISSGKLPADEMDLDYTPDRSRPQYLGNELAELERLAIRSDRGRCRRTSMFADHVDDMSEQPICDTPDGSAITINTAPTSGQQAGINNSTKRPFEALLDDQSITEQSEPGEPGEPVMKVRRMATAAMMQNRDRIQPEVRVTRQQQLMQVWLRHESLQKKIRLDINRHSPLASVVHSIQQKLGYRMHREYVVRLLNVSWDDCEDFVRSDDESGWKRLMEGIPRAEESCVEVEVL